MKINKKQLIYVVDDDKPLNAMISMFLKSNGLKNVHSFHSGEDFLENAQLDKKPIIVQDFDLPGMNGVEVIKATKKKHPEAEFIMLSGQSSIEVAVEAIKSGAYDYVIKDTFAKENALTKIKNILKMKAILLNKEGFKYAFYAFLILFGCSWVFIFFFLRMSGV